MAPTSKRSRAAGPAKASEPPGGEGSGDPTAGDPAGEDLGYEQARDELARVVAALEAGGLSLEDSLALWERGEALARRCERHLEGARERVETALAAARGPGGDDDADSERD